MRSIRTAAALVIFLTSSGCRLGEQTEVRQVPPELTMEGVQFWIDRGGSTRARGHADRVTLRRDTTEVAAERVTLLMPGAEGQEVRGAEGEVRLAAPAVTGVVSERRFVASGGVTVERDEDRAETATATYEPPPAATKGAGYQPAIATVHLLGGRDERENQS